MLRVVGSAYVADNDAELRVRSVPAGAAGFFLVGGDHIAPVQPPGSAGELCLGPLIGSFVRPGEIQQADAGGRFGFGST